MKLKKLVLVDLLLERIKFFEAISLKNYLPGQKFPSWIRVKSPGGENYNKLKSLMRKESLHTVCEEAHCPNIGECWESKSATFMILGDICTRSCAYCAVKSGRPETLDLLEPLRLASTVKKIGLRYCVITSVNRDELPDGGAKIFGECVIRIRELSPECKVEILVPDFLGNEFALKTVINAKPDIFNHNIETVPRIFRKVRPKGKYHRSLDVLKMVKELDNDIPTKSGIILGMGETFEEVIHTLRDLRDVGCDLLTVGQYLQPSPTHVQLEKFYTPQEFESIKSIALEMGFVYVASGPLVRSSYHAEEQYEAMNKVRI